MLKFSTVLYDVEGGIFTILFHFCNDMLYIQIKIPFETIFMTFLINSSNDYETNYFQKWKHFTFLVILLTDIKSLNSRGLEKIFSDTITQKKGRGGEICRKFFCQNWKFFDHPLLFVKNFFFHHWKCLNIPLLFGLRILLAPFHFWWMFVFEK